MQMWWWVYMPWYATISFHSTNFTKIGLYYTGIDPRLHLPTQIAKKKPDRTHKPECSHFMWSRVYSNKHRNDNTLSWHSCWTLLLDTLAGHSCWTLLLDILAWHSCWTLFLDTLPWHSCWTLWTGHSWQDTPARHSCWTFLLDTLAGHSLSWHSSLTLLLDTLDRTLLTGHSC